MNPDGFSMVERSTEVIEGRKYGERKVSTQIQIKQAWELKGREDIGVKDG